MDISKLARSISKNRSLLVVMMVVVAGLFLAKDLRHTALDVQAKTATQLTIEQINPQWSADFVVGDSCGSALIYLSLPPKCRTADGEFIPFGGTPSNIVVVPGLK